MEVQATARFPKDGTSAPRTDVLGWAAIIIVGGSLIWTLGVSLYALASDPCASSGDQCVLVLGALVLWVMGQVVLFVPQAAAIAVLGWRAAQGNARLPLVGASLFTANCALTVAFYWYLSTLPFYFR